LEVIKLSKDLMYRPSLEEKDKRMRLHDLSKTFADRTQ